MWKQISRKVSRAKARTILCAKKACANGSGRPSAICEQTTTKKLTHAFCIAAFVVPTVLAAAEPWEANEHGRMLKRILPPGPPAKELPQAGSQGTRLLEQYCVQCHYLPDPRMHSPEHWPQVVERMVRRMRGEGNLGPQMKELMQDVAAPDDSETAELIEYLQRHGQQPIDGSRYADLDTPEGRAFSQACSQCHTLPDPQRHTAQEWPEVVERMKKHLLWIGVVSSNRAIGNPSQFSAEEILDFLKRNSRGP